MSAHPIIFAPPTEVRTRLQKGIILEYNFHREQDIEGNIFLVKLT